MDYIRFSITNPVKVSVGVLLVLLFGVLALMAIPIQLTPNVDQPLITVETRWTGRSPEEIEREVVEEQEDKLKAVSNLKKMVATASQGQAKIELEFYIGTEMTRAIQEVSDKLREVPEYPDEVDEPVITAANSSSENAIAWIILDSTDDAFDIQGFYDTADKRIKPYLERVSGLSRVNIYGGRERQAQIRVDPVKMAARGIRFGDFQGALRGDNVNVSAGDLADGRLDVRVRTVGQYNSVEEVEQTILKMTDGGPVRVRDVAQVVLTLEKRRSFVRANGKPALAINAIRETGSNVIEVMEGLRSRIQELNRDVLPGYGHGLKMRQVYDETVYIYDALDLVLNNLWMGGGLAVVVLLAFLRKIRPTAIIALAIPVSVVGTFVAMAAFGRNLNVVSLAGLAFAVGMVVDNGIVVLENIDRHLHLGKKPIEAAYDATKEVWGAILASTLTTVVVFVPVFTMQEEAGQLFRDISLAVCGAVLLSLMVSITVIPCAGARWLKPVAVGGASGGRSVWGLGGLFGLTTGLGRVTEGIAGGLYWLTGRDAGRFFGRVVLVGLAMALSLWGAGLLKPPTSYLPAGNRNLVFGIMFTPPAYTLNHVETIGDRVERRVRPYWEAKNTAEATKLGPVMDFESTPLGPYREVPAIDNYFFVSFGGTVFMGCSSKDKELVGPLGSVLTASMGSIPGSFGFAKQTSIFGRGASSSNSVDVEVSSNDLKQLRVEADAMYQQLAGAFGYQAIRPSPLNFNLAGPEMQVKLDQVRAKDLGLDVAELGLAIETMVDGATVGDYRVEGDSIDLVLVRDPGYAMSADQLGQMPLAAVGVDGAGATVPMSAVMEVVRTEAPQEIKRIEEARAVTFSVEPPRDVPLEAAQDRITQVTEQMRASGQLGRATEVRMAGTADKLTEIRRAMLGRWTGMNLESVGSVVGSRFFLALLITYLLMAALFESFLYPFVIMFSVPLAMLGGFTGLRIVHTLVPTQHLDVVTMLGFIILIGIVVNNAILIVHQALNYMKGLGESGEGIAKLAPREAIRESVLTRMRPVMMTTMTTVFGMLPLVAMPGSGSELYRGLGSVILGGLCVSTFLTLLVVPLAFSLVFDVKVWVYRLVGKEVPELAG